MVDVVMELVWLWSSCGDGGHVVMQFMWWLSSCDDGVSALLLSVFQEK